ncbi:hypothetical protein PR048_010393 [Dryococelus australis]|uniref:Uncharacterized protein n=1 Tax=Dryococelus australis TaxID=614101 RepID=A0ABQ9I2L2_9NEOP|nr:hypothetical protein PR048_010393 [Dryococelus australis]
MNCVIGKFAASRTFLGLYETSLTTRHELSKIINDVITLFGLSFSDSMGQCYDGESNIKSKFRGFITIIQNQQSLALCLHCGNLSLHLALQDCFKNIPLRNTLQATYYIGVLLWLFPKRKALFSNIFQYEAPGVNSLLRPLTLHDGQYERLHEQLEKCSVYLALLICCKIILVTEKLSSLLQKPTISTILTSMIFLEPQLPSLLNVPNKLERISTPNIGHK